MDPIGAELGPDGLATGQFPDRFRILASQHLLFGVFEGVDNLAEPF